VILGTGCAVRRRVSNADNTLDRLDHDSIQIELCR
jgi:hypothetical protein